jgi:hypothetical protein
MEIFLRAKIAVARGSNRPRRLSIFRRLQRLRFCPVVAPTPKGDRGSVILSIAANARAVFS